MSAAASALLRAVSRGEMPLDAGCKFGSVLGRKIRAMEMSLKYGPFLP